MNTTEAANKLKADLAVEVLHSFGEARLRVTGTSMLPAVWPGDILTIRRQGIQEIRAGDLVLSRREGRFFAHRVVRCDSGPGAPSVPRLRNSSIKAHSASSRAHSRSGGAIPFIVTRGDRLSTPDPPIGAENLLGRVTSIERGGRLIDPRLTGFGRLGAWVLRRSELMARTVVYVNRRLAMQESRRN